MPARQAEQRYALRKHQNGEHLPARIAGSGLDLDAGRSSTGGLLAADPGLFFKPVQFHLQSPYLRVQALWAGRWLHRLRTTLAVKQYRGLFLQLFFPQTNLGGMYPKFLGKLVDRLNPTNRFQCDLGLELAAEYLALLLAHYLPFLQQVTILNHCLEIGVHYIT